MTSKLDGCLKDLREQAEIGYDTITVEQRDWERWEKEITEEVGKITGYEPAERDAADGLLIVAENTWRRA